MSKLQPVVLVAPLNWGLGHATRCIPLIQSLLKLNCTVIIAAEGGGEAILKKEFPECMFINIPGIKINYPANGNMFFKMLYQIPSILLAIGNEHACLKQQIQLHKITHVISDNRYGLFSKKCKTAFVTHQVNISAGKGLLLLENIINKINRFFIENFDELWIPDFSAENNLSGRLSAINKINIPTKFLGSLSRFNSATTAIEKKYEFIALLSGPEPQRTLLEQKCTEFFGAIGKKYLIIQGLPENNNDTANVVSSIADETLKNILHPDTILICRPGYSTIMDLTALQHHRILFVPTPGQTEQEYLAERMNKIFGVPFISQRDAFPDFEKLLYGKIPAHKTTAQLTDTIINFLK